MLVNPGFATWKMVLRRRPPSRDDVLDYITLYWLTNTWTSAARLFWENGGRGPTASAAWKTTEIKLPVAITIFGEDPFRPPESWARRIYPSPIYFHQTEKGGNFAAWAAGAVRRRDAGGVSVAPFELGCDEGIKSFRTRR